MGGRTTVVGTALIRRDRSRFVHGAGPAGPDGEPAWWRADSPWGEVSYSWNRSTWSGLVWGSGVPTTAIRYRPGMVRISGHEVQFDGVPREGLVLILGGREGQVQQPGTKGLLTGLLRSFTRDGRAVTAQVQDVQWDLRAAGAGDVRVARDGAVVARGGTGLKARFDLESGCTPDDLAVTVLLCRTVGGSLFPSNFVG